MLFDLTRCVSTLFLTLWLSAFIGGKAKNGAPIVTFPDRQGAPDVSDEDYKKVITYLCGLIP